MDGLRGGQKRLATGVVVDAGDSESTNNGYWFVSWWDVGEHRRLQDDKHTWDENHSKLFQVFDNQYYFWLKPRIASSSPSIVSGYIRPSRILLTIPIDGK